MSTVSDDTARLLLFVTKKVSQRERRVFSNPDIVTEAESAASESYCAISSTEAFGTSLWWVDRSLRADADATHKMMSRTADNLIAREVLPSGRRDISGGGRRYRRDASLRNMA